jgi:cellobiose phosphorylase
MNDWFTGSGCVLLKVLIWYAFGIKPTLEGVYISPANYLPFENASMKVSVKGVEISIALEKANAERRFFVNGKEVQGVYDEKLKAQAIYLSNEALKAMGSLKITVQD